MAKNVLFISYSIPPNGGIAGFRSGEFIHFLPEFDWRPIVLTAHQLAGRPTAEREDLHDHVVYHLPRFPYYKLFKVFWKFRLHKLVPFLYTPDPEMYDIARQTRAGIDIARRENCDAIYSTSFPRSSHVVARNIRRATGLPWVADSRDPWIELGEMRYATPLHKLISRRLERTVVAEADALVVASQGTADLWAKRGISGLESKVTVIPNGYRESDFSEPVHSLFPDDGRVHLASVGTIYGSYDGRLYRDVVGVGFPTEFFLGLRELLDEHPALREEIRVHFIGNFDEDSASILDECNLTDVVCLHGFKPKDESVQFMRAADGLVLIPPSDMPAYTVPARTYEYLRSGRPILAIVGEGDARDIVRRGKHSICVDPGDVKGIATGLRELIGSAREHTAPEITFSEFDRRNQTATLAEILNSIRDRRSASHGPCLMEGQPR